MTVRDSFLCKTPIAHRGLHEGVPENSRAAFARAIEEGYAIETDVRRTKDGTLVVIHDDNLKRMTGTEGKVSRTSYRELADLRLCGTEEKIMTLQEFLEYVDGRAPVLLEVKDLYTVVNFPREVVHVMQQYRGEYALQSFNPFYVHRFKQLAPDVLRGQLAVGIFFSGSAGLLSGYAGGLRHFAGNFCLRRRAYAQAGQGSRGLGGKTVRIYRYA